MDPRIEDRFVEAAAARIATNASSTDVDGWRNLFAAVWLDVMNHAFTGRLDELLGNRKGVIEDLVALLRRGVIGVGAIFRRIDDAAEFAANATDAEVVEAAERLAELQVLPAVTMGEQVAASAADEQLSGRVVKTWRTVGDDRVRDWHAAANGQTVPVDDLFNVGPDLLLAPRDPSGSPANVINCRCTADHTIQPLT